MDSIILCKDCGDQFKSPHRDGICGELFEIIKESHMKVYLTHCMGLCPTEKISTIIFKEEQINQFKIETFSIETIKEIIK